MQPILSYQKGKLVFCKWVDSAKDDGAWTYGEYVPRVIHIESCGLVASNKDGILTLTTALDETNDGVMAPLNIPWACIEKIKELS